MYLFQEGSLSAKTCRKASLKARSFFSTMTRSIASLLSICHFNPTTQLTVGDFLKGYLSAMNNPAHPDLFISSPLWHRLKVRRPRDAMLQRQPLCIIAKSAPGDRFGSSADEIRCPPYVREAPDSGLIGDIALGQLGANKRHSLFYWVCTVYTRPSLPASSACRSASVPELIERVRRHGL